MTNIRGRVSPWGEHRALRQSLIGMRDNLADTVGVALDGEVKANRH